MNTLNEPEMATSQKMAPFKGIDGTLSQPYLKRTCMFFELHFQ